MIENPDIVISLIEKAKLVNVLSNKHDGIKHNIETRYKLSNLEIHRY